MDKKQLKLIIKNALPPPALYWLRTQRRAYKHHPPLGKVKWGELRQLKPISFCCGLDRGQPIDRYYIEQFLAHNDQEIQGRVLEVGNNFYTRKFGGDRILTSDVLHAIADNPDATIVANLADAPQIPSNSFDCFILTQTLQYVYDVQRAVRTIHRILKPGGVVLVTLPNLTPIVDPESKSEAWGSDCWYWGFTNISAQKLFAEVFSAENVQVEPHGNLIAATAFLQGLSSQELKPEELNHCDPRYQVIITVRAVKREVAL